MLSKISLGTLKSWEEDELLSLLVLTALKADARAIDDAMAIAAAAAESRIVTTFRETNDDEDGDEGVKMLSVEGIRRNQ